MSTLILENSRTSTRSFKIIDLLTLQRARTYAVISLVMGCFLVSSAWISESHRLTASVDFPAFYNAGRLVNEYPGARLYDREIQESLYIELVPAARPQSPQITFFTYTPFFALLCAPFAALPYLPAFFCWAIVSLALFVFGFRLLWTTADLPPQYFSSGLLIAVSFMPFFAWCVLAGQTSAFGFFALALVIYLERSSQPFASGLVLALLLYKPPLLIFLLPMLLITKRWRTLAGFCVGGSVLGLISLALIGFSGMPAYLEMLTSFSTLKLTGRRPTGVEIDGFSFFFGLVHGHAEVAGLLFLVTSVAVLPFLVRAWLRMPSQAWSTAIAWGLVLNLYVLIYDATLVIITVVLTVGAVVRTESELPRSLRWILLALFVVPWFETNLARIGFQPLTLAMIAFGCYLLLPHFTSIERNSSSALVPSK